MRRRAAHGAPRGGSYSRRQTGQELLRRWLTSTVALACAASLIAVHALPAFAEEATETTPKSVQTALQQEQRYAIAADVEVDRTTSDWLQADPGGWTAPVPGKLRDGFGPRANRPVAGVSIMHRGQDLAAACGQEVRAASAGMVLQAGWFGSYGNWVLLRHGQGLTTGYAHNMTLLVRAGQQVEAGQLIAYAGTTGASSGCHLHLEVRTGSTAVDPRAFLARRGVALG